MQGNYLLNGNWRIDLPLPKEIFGSKFLYTRGADGEDAAETISASGPTNQPIFLVVSLYIKFSCFASCLNSLRHCHEQNSKSVKVFSFKPAVWYFYSKNENAPVFNKFNISKKKKMEIYDHFFLNPAPTLQKETKRILPRGGHSGG